MHKRLTVMMGLFLSLTLTGASLGALAWDEGSFLLNAKHFLGQGRNIEESRPAALSYLIAGVWGVTGEHVLTARIIIILFGAATIFVFSRLAADEFSHPLRPTAAFAFAPLLLYWSFHAYTDVPALFFVLSSLYLYRRDHPFLSGVVLAVGITFRYVFLVFAVGMGMTYLWKNRTYLLRYVIGGVVGAIPFFVYSTIMYGSPVAKAVMYVSRVTTWSGSGLFATTQLSMLAALAMLAALLPGTVLGWKQTALVEKLMIVTYAGFFLFFSGNAFTRYWLPIVPMLLLISYRGLRSWPHLFPLSVGLMILVSGIGIGMDAAALQMCSQPFNRATQTISGHQGAVVSDRWAVAGYRLDQRVYAPWTDYQTLHQEYNVTYAITTNPIPYDQIAVFSNRCRTYHVYDLRHQITPAS